MKVKRIFLLALILFSSCIIKLYSQHLIIDGQVLSRKRNLPVENASVQIGQFGCTTNKVGKFVLNIDKKTLEKNNLVCSSIGYATRIIIGNSVKTPVIIELEDSVGNLPEVIVSLAGKTIVEKAIARISLNYPGRPFIVSGILRLLFEQDNGYSYKNDAFIDIYTPSYVRSNKGDVRLVKNKVNIRMGNGFDSSQAIKWATAYNAAVNYDFVLLRSEFIQLKSMKHFTYSLKEKAIFENHRVFVVDFLSHDDIRGVPYKEMSGTLLIDTASYAFVRGDFTFTDVKYFFYNRVKKYSTTVIYEDSGEKWHLKRMKREMEYDPIDNIQSNSSISFATTSLDSINVHKFSYNDIIQNSDITQRVNKVADSTEWIKYDSLFVKAEKENDIVNIKTVNTDTLNNQSERYTLTFSQIMQSLARIVRDHYRVGIAISKLPIGIIDGQDRIASSVQFSFGFIGQIRLSKTLFFETDAYFNAGIGGIKNKQTGYYLVNVFAINRNHRPLFLSALGGYNKIVLTNSDKSMKSTFNNWVLGFTMSMEINRKFNVFAGSSYNYNFSKNVADGIAIRPARFCFSSGIIYKL